MPTSRHSLNSLARRLRARAPDNPSLPKRFIGWSRPPDDATSAGAAARRRRPNAFRRAVSAQRAPRSQAAAPRRERPLRAERKPDAASGEGAPDRRAAAICGREWALVSARDQRLIFEAAGVVGLALILTAFVLSFIIAAPRTAQGASPQLPAFAAPPAGLFFRAGREDALFAAPGLESDVVLEVHGEVVRAKVRQRFANPAPVWLEGVYVFPLPQGAAVDRLAMRVGERRIEGRILPKEEAEAVYKTAAQEGRKASLLASVRPNVFVTSLANIAPGETVSIEIEYQDRALYRDGGYELRFPMVVAPRYSPSGGEAPLVSLPAPPTDSRPFLQPIAEKSLTPAAPAETPAETPAAFAAEAPGRDLFGPVRKPEAGPKNRLTLAVHLDAGLPIGALESLYHPVLIETPAPERRVVTLAAGSVPADRDFVLAWRPAPAAAPAAAVFAEEVAGESYLAGTLVPPALADGAAPPVPRELILVVDTSGSMAGSSIAQAKAALLLALERLRAGDRFNLIRFASDREALFAAPRRVSAANLARAFAYIASFRADGGTDMRPALDLALRQAASPDHLRQIVFLTDGAVSNEQELFATIAARLEGARLFTVGLGSAPNGYFMRKAAEVGRGSFLFIGDLGEAEARMAALFRKLESPLLTDLTVGWPGAAGKDVALYPAPLPDLYAGETVTFTAKVAGTAMAELDGAVLVTGRTGAATWQRQVPLEALAAAPGVAALWARAKIADIRDGLTFGKDPAEVRAAATEVALKHRLVSVYTSLVAVDAPISRPPGAPRARREIPRELPAGWDYEKVFGAAGEVMRLQPIPASFMQALGGAAASGQPIALPQTATPAARQALVGLGLLAFGGYLLLLLGRLRGGGAGHG